ncbi:hypothetical protein ACFW4T_13220 [Streptomyces mutabilis]|uniref:hypothetical protein n=1 Tax=Streptomyces mutabilis TaxID=67332 RepID=UPI0036B30C8C
MPRSLAVVSVTVMRTGGRAVRSDQVIEGPAGPVFAAGQRGHERGRGVVEEIGAEFVPADGDVVDEVLGHGLDVASEHVLVGGQEEREVVAGHAVELDVDAAVPRAGGGAGDEGVCGQGVLRSEEGAGDVLGGRRSGGRVRLRAV